ncbi:MAG: DUF2180 family protein [Acidimicrobiales bacterium]
MHCLDCNRDRQLLAPEVAVCPESGAGVCEDHLVVRTHHLTRVEPLVRQVPVDLPARRVHCVTCDDAWQAATGTAGCRRRNERQPA